jgi:hypothetical protein
MRTSPEHSIGTISPRGFHRTRTPEGQEAYYLTGTFTRTGGGKVTFSGTTVTNIRIDKQPNGSGHVYAQTMDFLPQNLR